MNKLEKAYPELVIVEPESSQKVIENKFFRLLVPREASAVINDEGGTIKMADSAIEFAVAELPIQVESEDDYLKIYKLILSEYLPDQNAEIIIANSRMIGSGMRDSKDNVFSFSILLISSKNQYLFKLSSKDRRQMIQFKGDVIKIAKSLVETGEIYGVGVELNDLPLPSTIYIELYKIDAYDEPISEEEFFSQSEYDNFLEFSASEPSEYIPDIISEFCQINGIDEDKRKIGILAYNFEKKERSNYNMWESSVLNKYYDAIYEDHNPFMFSQNSL